MSPLKPIFLDRDGVINVDLTPYVSSAEDLELFPWTVEALVKLDRAGYDIYVISNQQGVALGVTPPEALDAINEKIQKAVEPYGFQIKKFYYCTAHDSENDPCRKPAPGMILKARDEFGLELSGAYFVGDKDSDMECGLRAGCLPLLVLSGVAGHGDWHDWPHQPYKVFKNLLEAAEFASLAGDDVIPG
jgi:D-glycero-D-manno-heptose 1,7-bisphosphate phosphatase